MAESTSKNVNEVIRIIETVLEKAKESLKEKLKDKSMTEHQWSLFLDCYDEITWNAIYTVVKDTIKRV